MFSTRISLILLDLCGFVGGSHLALFTNITISLFAIQLFKNLMSCLPHEVIEEQIIINEAVLNKLARCVIVDGCEILSTYNTLLYIP